METLLSINQNIAEAYISLQSTTSLVLKGTLSTFECSTKLSEPINISVNQTVSPILSIIPTDTCACNASNFSFSYKIDSYGQNYSTKWYVNGSNVAQDAAIFNPSNLQPGDKVWVTHTSSLKCVQPATTTSRKVEIRKCTNALLKQITIGNSCSFLPIFNPNIFEYYVFFFEVDTEIPKIEGIPVSSDASVSITMPSTLSGKAILTVTAEDQSYTKTYTINIHHPKYEQEYPILTSAKMKDQQTIELIFNIPINEFSVLFDDFSINTSTSCSVVRTTVDKNQKTRLLLDLNTTLPEGLPVYLNYMPGLMSDIYNRLLAGFTMHPCKTQADKTADIHIEC
ncbi:MAG: hypothetical protein IPO21_04930 [Bacteroidales bacterium]|nr:hypothetical protein [Bacteroidales bacterium]